MHLGEFLHEQAAGMAALLAYDFFQVFTGGQGVGQNDAEHRGIQPFKPGRIEGGPGNKGPACFPLFLLNIDVQAVDMIVQGFLQGGSPSWIACLTSAGIYR